MNIVHLTASTFYGGPERQMLGLAIALPDAVSVFLSFAEGGRCSALLSEVSRRGFAAHAIQNDTPHLLAATREIAGRLESCNADVLLCHGYKANLIGRIAARRVGIPAIAVSRGWTGESTRVRIYEAIDRWHLRWMDHVVAVSEAQAAKVTLCSVPAKRLTVIRNAIDPGRFSVSNANARSELIGLFANPPRRIIGAAGRLSPEKGFGVLISAARKVVDSDPTVAFVHFGDGPLRENLARQVAETGLDGRFILAGFRGDLDRFMPHFDLFVLPSYTEGLPNVVLESFAAGVPVVGTAVGGTPEVIDEGKSGYLVPPGDPEALAQRIEDALSSGALLREMGALGRQRVIESFSFAARADRYRQLFRELGIGSGRSTQAVVEDSRRHSRIKDAMATVSAREP